MNNTTISLNLENLNNDERKLLMSLVEKGNKPKSKVWKPETGNFVYVITADNTINRFTYKETNNYDRMAYNIGNLFSTNDAAEEEAKRRKIIKRWKDLSIESGEEDNPWNADNAHFKVVYNVTDKEIRTYPITFNRDQSVCFRTKQSILDAIKEIGEENVKKYILNVKE